MQTIPPDKPRSRDAFRRIRNATLAILVVMFIALGSWTSWWWGWAKRAVNVELAKVQQAGEPVTFDELNSYYCLNTNSADATPLWQEALKDCDEQAIKSIASPSERLQRYAETLRKLHRAAEHDGKSRYPIDVVRWPHATLDHLKQIRGAGRLLGDEARHWGEQGDSAKAVLAIHVLARLSRSLDLEPLELSQLTRLGCQSEVFNVVEQLLSSSAIADCDLPTVQADLRLLDNSRAVYLALLGERVSGITAIRNPQSADLPQSARGIVNSFGPKNRDADLSFFLQLTTRQIATTNMAWLEGRNEAHRLEAEMKATFANSTLAKARYTITGIYFPLASALFDVTGRSTVRRDAATAAIAVERFQREFGRPPRELAELVPRFLPQIPVDPFSTKSLRYQVRSTDCLIYSVGRDGKDDGGKCDHRFEPDIAFTLPRRDLNMP